VASRMPPLKTTWRQCVKTCCWDSRLIADRLFDFLWVRTPRVSDIPSLQVSSQSGLASTSRHAEFIARLNGDWLVTWNETVWARSVSSHWVISRARDEIAWTWMSLIRAAHLSVTKLERLIVIKSSQLSSRMTLARKRNSNNEKKPALTRVQRPTPAIFCDSWPWPLTLWPQDSSLIISMPGLVILAASIVDISCGKHNLFSEFLISKVYTREST